MNQNKAKFIVIPFIILIFGLFFINIINPDKEVSASENRALKQRPTKEDKEDKSYASDYEAYYSDQFAFREELSDMYTKLEILLGKNKVKNYYLLDDNWIMPTPIKNIDESKIKSIANNLNDMARIGKKSNKEIYYVSTPHKENILAHMYEKGIKDVGNAQKNKDMLKEYIDKDDVKFIDLDNYFLNNFDKDKLESFYFKTDHHWNGIGAFEGFKYIIEKMNVVENILRDDYTITNLDRGYFLGSYNKNLNKLVDENEEIPYVHLKDKSNYKYFRYDGKKEFEIKEEQCLASARNKDDILYGGAYMFGEAFVKLQNEDALIDKKIIIFRDSYQAPTSWLFADIFKEVQIVDPRHVKSIDMSCSEILEKSDADIAMFMYNSVDFEEMIGEMKK